MHIFKLIGRYRTNERKERTKTFLRACTVYTCLARSLDERPYVIGKPSKCCALMHHITILLWPILSQSHKPRASERPLSGSVYDPKNFSSSSPWMHQNKSLPTKSFRRDTVPAQFTTAIDDSRTLQTGWLQYNPLCS